jgi:hypothetical protein
LRIQQGQQLPSGHPLPQVNGPLHQFAAHPKPNRDSTRARTSAENVTVPVRSLPATVSNLTERKGSGGASVLEHATKVVTKPAKAHKRKLALAASDIKKCMVCPKK